MYKVKGDGTWRMNLIFELEPIICSVIQPLNQYSLSAYLHLNLC